MEFRPIAAPIGVTVSPPLWLPRPPQGHPFSGSGTPPQTALADRWGSAFTVSSQTQLLTDRACIELAEKTEFFLSPRQTLLAAAGSPLWQLNRCCKLAPGPYETLPTCEDWDGTALY